MSPPNPFPAVAESTGGSNGDLELVAALRRGDEAAFATFEEVHLPALYRFALGRLDGDRELSRDLVQATVCRVLRRLGSYRGEASFLTWLCACCRNEIAAHFRRQGRRPVEVELEQDEEAAPGPLRIAVSDPEAETLQLETRERVHLALGEVGPRYASALVSRYLEGQNVPTVARRLGLGYKAAESLLSRARRAFEEAYRGLPGGEVDPWTLE